MSDDRHQQPHDQRPECGHESAETREPPPQARAAWPFDKWLRLGLHQVWRLIILIVGGTVVLLGLVMLVTPGPALVVVPIGLAILAVEFAWARRMLQRVRARAAHYRDQYTRWRR